MDQNRRNSAAGVTGARNQDNFYGQANRSNDFSNTQQSASYGDQGMYPQMGAPVMMQQPIMYPPVGYPFFPNQNALMLEPIDDYERYPSKPNGNKVYDSSTLRRIEEIRKIRKKQDDYIYCCSLCDRPSNDTCYFCWRIWACPTWCMILSILIILLIIAGLGTVLGLVFAKVIKV